MKLKSPYLIKPGHKVKLSSYPTGEDGSFKKSDDALPVLEKNREKLSELQEVFYAAQSKALLIVLQGMDTAGKDGTIRHIFTGFNPQGCQVAAFKVPTALELRHDFLWRCHAQVPPKGMVGVFNRSHYEDVLSPRVHGKLSKKQVRQRTEDINDWEHMLYQNGTVILKFFLHISREEQTERLQSRIDSKDKHWKLSPSDFEERPFWSDYMSAYQDIFEQTSQKHAPWFVIPADKKWFRNVVISNLLVEAMEGLKLKYPPPSFDPSGMDLSALSPEEAGAEARERSAAPAIPDQVRAPAGKAQQP